MYFSIALISPDPTLQQQLDSMVACHDAGLTLYSYVDIPNFLTVERDFCMVMVDDTTGKLATELLTEVATKHSHAIRVLFLPDLQDEQLLRQLSAYHLFYSRSLSGVQFTELLYRPQRLQHLKLPMGSIEATLTSRSLPVNAAIAMQLQEMLMDPNMSIEPLLPVIEQDAVLCSRLLQLANSPYMGFTKPTSSLEAALGRIGLNLLYGMVMMLTAADAHAEEPLPDWLLWTWQHARLSRQLAHSLELPLELQELCFSCALLNGIGVAVLNQDPQLLAQNLTSHDVSAVLLTVWGFGDTYIAPLLRLHQVPSDLTLPEQQIATVLAVAALLQPPLASAWQHQQSLSSYRASLPAEWQAKLA